MPRLTWLTDIHLNFVREPGLARFLTVVADEQPDVLVITGDIAEAPDFARYLSLLVARVPARVAFVLGNHDFYRGSIAAVRRAAVGLCRDEPRLTCLSDSDAVELAPGVGLIGHDGWYDARLGDWLSSDVALNDYLLIRELALAGRQYEDREGLRRELQRQAAEAAGHIRRVLPPALDRYEHVFVATHVPPFKEACVYMGRPSDDNWLPHMSSKAMGDALLEVAAARPDRRITVLCGHTHGAGQAQLLPNLLVLTGGATYGQPQVQRTWEL